MSIRSLYEISCTRDSSRKRYNHFPYHPTLPRTSMEQESLLFIINIYCIRDKRMVEFREKIVFVCVYSRNTIIKSIAWEKKNRDILDKTVVDGTFSAQKKTKGNGPKTINYHVLRDFYHCIVMPAPKRITIDA